MKPDKGDEGGGGVARNKVQIFSINSDPIVKEDYFGNQCVDRSELRRCNVLRKTINYPFLVVVIKIWRNNGRIKQTLQRKKN